MTAWADALVGALILAATTTAYAQDDPAVVEAAKKEGSMTLYTSNLTENELDLLKHFNKRHPFLKVGIVRAPGGQLVTRIKSEAAAGKLTADMVTLSDRGLAATIADLFADYAPPNAADYPPETVTLGKLWPRTVVVWTIAYNDALVKNPPRTWKDLTDPAWRGLTGEVVILSGGSTWGRSMYQRKTFGDGYWGAVAAHKPTLYPSGAPASDALSRGEIAVLPVLLNQIMPKAISGAPVKWTFPSDGVPIIPQVDGIPKTATSPNAAKLFLNWALSPEGQAILVKEQGFLSVLKTVPKPEGFGADTKTWVPDETETEKLRATWTEDWNKTFNYRQ